MPGRAGFVIAFACCLVGCTGGKDPWAERPGPRVLAYFPPLASLASAVAGEDAQVRSLISHVGPHHFDPSSRDALALRRADVFLTNGLGLDDMVAKKLADTMSNPKLHHVALGSLIPKDQLREGGCNCEHGHDHAHQHDPDHPEYDPHVWLGIPEAILMVGGIRDELCKVDPSHADGYRARAAATIDRLNNLLVEGKAQLATKKEKPKLVSFHDSLFYFARPFGIEIVDSIEAPGEEPSPQKLKKIVEACKKNGVRLIAVEPQYPTHTSARVILEELKRHGIEAAFVEIDPLETSDVPEVGAGYYEKVMRANIANLAGVLK